MFLSVPKRMCFYASSSGPSQAALALLEARFGSYKMEEADVIVPLGGDGHMLGAMHTVLDKKLTTPLYGLNRGRLGFLMNAFNPVEMDRLPERISQSIQFLLKPLKMTVETDSGHRFTALALNEVSLFRQTSQAAHLQISIDGQLRLPELIADGVMVSTVAGSTAYNFSAGGPILPMGSNVLAMTPICAFRPRRWHGALLPYSAVTEVEVLSGPKRPVSASADTFEYRDCRRVRIEEESQRPVNLLFDPGHDLTERIWREQFMDSPFPREASL